MIRIEKSGLYHPNKIAHIYLEALEEIVGRQGLVAVLRVAGLADLIDNYPPLNLDKAFDFADYSALNGALDEIYGPRGGRGLALRAGRASFDRGLKDFGALAGVGKTLFARLALDNRLRIGLSAMAKIVSHFSDQYTTMEDMGEYYVCRIPKCPVCWGRTSDRPVCFACVGLLQEALKWLGGGPEFRVEETSCVAMGDDCCSFQIMKEPVL